MQYLKSHFLMVDAKKTFLLYRGSQYHVTYLWRHLTANQRVKDNNKLQLKQHMRTETKRVYVELATMALQCTWHIGTYALHFDCNMYASRHCLTGTHGNNAGMRAECTIIALQCKRYIVQAQCSTAQWRYNVRFINWLYNVFVTTQFSPTCRKKGW